ncbi:MAG: pyridoxine 5'-phosphate synthase [Deltaproteobacteria bacterium]|nr:pyridoxine 5'-phosphate synthase [Deltaproteobacteria bacterium]
MSLALHVNVDHVATLRQARGTRYPDPVEAAIACERAGAEGITVHLREDRRHIQERDVRVLKEVVRGTYNLEMAASDDGLAIALAVRPDHVTLVPERREERTTEGGLDAAGQRVALARVIDPLRAAGIRVSLFIAPDDAQIDAAVALGAEQIELHTGDYADATGAHRREALAALRRGAARAKDAGLRVAAGHGLTVANVVDVAAIAAVEELNIGHAIIADAVIMGIADAVRSMRDAMDRGRATK